MIRVYDEAGNVIETHEHKGEFKDNFAARPICFPRSNLGTGKAEVAWRAFRYPGLRIR